MSRKLEKDEKVMIYQLYPRAWRGGFKKMERWLPQIALLFDSAELSEKDYELNLLGELFIPSKSIKSEPAKKNPKVSRYVWLSPFFSSSNFDGGYDITDYCSIDEKFGSFIDFAHFVNTAHRLNLKVMLDLVPNHTSSSHPWFLEALRGDPTYVNYYIHADHDLGWKSIWENVETKSGEYAPASAWMPDLDQNGRKTYFLHSFSPYQADLNWENPAVIAKFKYILDFWLYRGVDAFRIDCCQFLKKDLVDTNPNDPFGGFKHFFRQPGCTDILHQLFDDYPVFTLGEAFPTEFPTLSTDNIFIDELVGESGPLSACFDASFPDIITVGAKKYRDSVIWQETLAERFSTPGFVVSLESHDGPRFASRDAKLAKRLPNYLGIINPQGIIVYQGQEFGEVNPHLRLAEYFQDPQTRSQFERISIDSEYDDVREYLWGAAQMKPDYPAPLKHVLENSRENARHELHVVRDNLYAIQSGKVRDPKWLEHEAMNSWSENFARQAMFNLYARNLARWADPRP